MVHNYVYKNFTKSKKILQNHRHEPGLICEEEELIIRQNNANLDWSRKERLHRLRRVLKRRFPGEQVSSLAMLLSLASEKGRVSYEEIKAEKETKGDLLLLAYHERLLLPIRTSQFSRTLAWEDRILIPEPGETYEMPNVTRYLIRKAEETGQWRPHYAVRRYLEHIGEPEKKKILRLFQEVKKKVANAKILSKTNKITPQPIKECSEKQP